MNKAYIIDIFWDRIYLNLIIETNGFKLDEIALFSYDSIYEEINIKTIGKDKYKAVINITNIKNSKMLKDGVYCFKFFNGARNDFQCINITTELGYKLEMLDKIYRYNKDCAYTLNFLAKETSEDDLICVLESMFMVSEKENIRLKARKKVGNCFKKLFGCMYKLFDLLHPNKNKKILLMSETRSPISENLKALDEQIKKRGIDKEYKLSYSFCKTLELGKIQFVINWIKLAWAISKQEIIFIDDYSPIFKYINLNKKTKLIQVWHAGVGFKSVGYARFGFSGPEPYSSCHRKYDYAIVGSKGVIPVYSEVFGIDKERILPYGLPRLDDFLDREKIDFTIKNVHDKYPILNGKKVILFAPTFRGKGQKEAYYPFDKIDLEKTYDMCNKNNYIFIFKMHPFIKSKIEIPEKFSDRIIDLSTYSNINDLLYLTDILITDYSSTIYDFSMLNRPILFYTFDLEKYEIINKVHRPIKEYAPGKICKTYDELINAINNKDFEMNKLQKYVEENFDEHDKKATDMIIDNLILKGGKND